MKSLLIALTVTCLPVLLLHADDPVVNFNDKGTAIHVGADAGPFSILGPQLYADKKILKFTGATVDGNTATLNFDGGSVLKTSINGTEIDFDFSQVDSSVTGFILSLKIDFSFHDGGQFKVGDTDGIFPPEKTTNPAGGLYGGKESTVLLTNGKGKTLEVTFPDVQYMHIIDNRFFKDTEQYFSVSVNIDRTPGVNQYKMTLK
jgi:hypothetical protein